MSGFAIILAAGIVWNGIVPENHLGGRQASAGYLQGKVFLVDCRDYSQDAAVLERIEEFWQSYKNKRFVVVGLHREGNVEEAKKNIQECGVTYPVYSDAEFKGQIYKPKKGCTFVFHEGGKLSSTAYDVNRAFEAAVTAMSWGAVPSKAEHFQKLIDYELKVLPGKAYLHIREMQKAFPTEAQAYAESFKKLDEDEEVRKVAKLEDISIRVMDFDRNSTRSGKPLKFSKQKLESLVESYSPLKESQNPLLAQETKNCIAELKWVMAEM